MKTYCNTQLTSIPRGKTIMPRGFPCRPTGRWTLPCNLTIWAVYFCEGYNYSSRLVPYRHRFLRCINHHAFCFRKSFLWIFFFLTSKTHSITQIWSGLDNQIGIKQPIKCNSLWNDLTVLTKKSEICLSARGIEQPIKCNSPSQNLAKYEVPLSLQSAPYSLSQNFRMVNVEACSPLPTTVLLLLNTRLIRVEWSFLFP